jgi:hypothetical protein
MPSLALTPRGHLLFISGGDDIGLSSALARVLEPAFARGSGCGLLELGASEVGTTLPADPSSVTIEKQLEWETRNEEPSATACDSIQRSQVGRHNKTVSVLAMTEFVLQARVARNAAALGRLQELPNRARARRIHP